MKLFTLSQVAKKWGASNGGALHYLQSKGVKPKVEYMTGKRNVRLYLSSDVGALGAGYREHVRSVKQASGAALGKRRLGTGRTQPAQAGEVKVKRNTALVMASTVRTALEQLQADMNQLIVDVGFLRREATAIRDQADPQAATVN